MYVSDTEHDYFRNLYLGKQIEANPDVLYDDCLAGFKALNADTREVRSSFAIVFMFRDVTCRLTFCDSLLLHRPLMQHAVLQDNR